MRKMVNVNKEIVFIGIFLLLSGTIKAKEWQKYIVNGAFSFEVPSTLELRADGDLYTKEVLKEHGCVINADKIVFQQKDLSVKDSHALLNQYCRIIINYQKGEADEYFNSNEDYVLTRDDIETIQSVIESDAAERLISIESIRYENKAQFSGIIAEYRRKGFGDNPPVRVQYHLIYNNNEMVTFVLSYREQEEAIWKDDLKKIIGSFSWNEKKMQKDFGGTISTFEEELPKTSKKNDGVLVGFLTCISLFFLLYFILKNKIKK